MAGSWIKFRHDLIDAPEIRRLSRSCGVTRDDVYGKLFRLWSWFDRHSHNGAVAGESGELVDEIVGHSGFAAALVSVGWLCDDQDGIVIPNWERHNSETAKERALDAARKALSRMSGSEPDTPDEACPAVRRTRLEKTRGDNPPPPPRDASLPEGRKALKTAWAAAAAAGHVQPWNASGMPDKADERLGEPGWLEDALQAIQRLHRCRYFDNGKPTLIQLCVSGFVSKVLGGQYDEPKPAKKQRTGDMQQEKLPPRGFTGDAAEAFERTRRALAKSATT
jgi:hypothetical protein